MTEQQLKIIDKVLKLMELAKEENNNHTAERESASRMAAKLMEEYALDFADLRTGKVKEGAFTKWDMEMNKEIVRWESRLANGISKAFDVHLVQSHTPWTLMFCGTKSDIDISVFFFNHLKRTVGIQAERSFKKKDDRIAFAFGATEIIVNRMQELYKKRNEGMSSTGTALMVVKTEGLDKFVNEMFPHLTKSRAVKIKGSWQAAEAGRAAGHKVNISRPIGHSGRASGKTISH